MNAESNVPVPTGVNHRENEQTRFSRSDRIWRGWFPLANLAVLTVFMLYVDGTSPVHKDHLDLWDTSIFRLAGWVWAEGGVPYVDYWDHKGPLIFFANLIGALVGGPDHGVFYVDVALMGIFMVFLWKILEVMGERLSVVVKTFVLWITVAWIAYLLVPNLNVTETVCMPFLTAALWLALRDMRRMRESDDASVAIVTAYVQGLAGAASLLTRVTNALPVCVCVLVLVVMLCMRKQWLPLIQCAATCIGGFLTLTVPFAVYFAMHNAFGEFLYGTVIFNLSYASGSSPEVAPGITVIGRILAVPVAMVIVALVHMIRMRSVSSEQVLLLIAGLLLSVLFLKTEMFLHYAVIAAEFIPIILALILTCMRTRWMQVTSLVVILAALMGMTVYQERISHGTPYNNEIVASVIEEAGDETVALYNLPAEAYLRYGLKPIYPYANLQDWQGKFSLEFRKRLLETYGSAKAEYLVVAKTNDLKEPAIQPILDSRYRLVLSVDQTPDGPISVYRRVG